MFVDVQEKDIVRRPTIQEAVGIDFGTTFCCIAYCDNPREPRVIGGLIPSVVAYGSKGEIKIGREALESGWPLIPSIKRCLSPEAAYNPLNTNDRDKALTPFQVAIDLFKGLRQHMAAYGIGHIGAAVVTVPAYFDEPRRQIIKQAATEAGFHVLRLISEPTAAALTYPLEEEGLYGVYDLGGGTFDFSVLTMHQGLFRVKATGGHPALGGDDIDEALGHFLYPHEPVFVKRYKGRFVKEDPNQTLLSLQNMRELVDPFIEETLSVCQKTLEEAEVEKKDLKAIILVGGSTKLPLVQQKVSEHFGHTLDTQLHPDEAVAIGAALQAYNLTHEASFLLLDVTPLSLGVETWGGLVEHIIPRHHPLPVHKEVEFTTKEDDQTGIKIHVVQGEQGLVAECRSLGSFELQGIPALPKGKARIVISFELDMDGLLTVSAYEKSAGVRQSLVVNAVHNLSYEMIEENVKREGEDVFQRLWIQKVEQAKDALSEVKRLLSLRDKDVQEKQLIQKACDELEQACLSQDLAQLMNQWEKFTEVALPFIEDYLSKILKEHFENTSPKGLN